MGRECRGIQVGGGGELGGRQGGGERLLGGGQVGGAEESREQGRAGRACRPGATEIVKIVVVVGF